MTTEWVDNIVLQADALTIERAVFILAASIGGVLLLVGPWLFALGRRYEARVQERDAAAFEAHVATTPVPIFPVGQRIRNPQLTDDARLNLAGAATRARELARQDLIEAIEKEKH